jgi:hypothetical protein
MLVTVGSVPVKDPSIKKGSTKVQGENLLIGDFSIPISAGTQTMIAAATVTCEALGLKAPYAVVAGDIGDGSGSDELFAFLILEGCTLSPKVVVVHYIYPSVGMKEVVETLKGCVPPPKLIADAGAMYNVATLGLAKDFDLFTPDPGEMAFLADPEAEHPMYVSTPIFEIDTTDIPALIDQAHKCGKAPKFLLVKGATDYIAREKPGQPSMGLEVVATINEPNIPALEPIGGTGDTITGIVSALIYGGYEITDAAVKAAKVNRIAGMLANPTPATPISQIIPQIPAALKKVLGK